MINANHAPLSHFVGQMVSDITPYIFSFILFLYKPSIPTSFSYKFRDLNSLFISSFFFHSLLANRRTYPLHRRGRSCRKSRHWSLRHNPQFIVEVIASPDYPGAAASRRSWQEVSADFCFRSLLKNSIEDDEQ